MSDNEVYSFALKSTLDEMRKACPDIQHAFMFKENGETIAGDAETSEKVVASVINAFSPILERAETIGGVEALTLNCKKGVAKVYRFNEHYLFMVTADKADLNYVNTLTRVLIPTVLKLLEKIGPAPLKNANPSPKYSFPSNIKLENKPEPEEELETEEENAETNPSPEEELIKRIAELRKSTEEPAPESAPEEAPSTIEIPPTQLIVENIGGLLVPSDTVRVDSVMLSQWESMLEGKKIELVEIETFDGKKAQYKVKPIKDSKFNGKGIVQMPEKAQLTLEIKKGELVRVKPVIE
ncbi:hypothetical protein KEJ45_02730 [Candidatus Bathyarchaeota archaeon]|nr:hypothetical protein [Candidatus Bathyarchaeota archaeon]